MIDDGRNRRQDIIRLNLNTEEKRVVASGEDVMTPVYYDNTLLYSIEGESFSPVESMNGYRVLGIDYTKIILAGKEGRVIFDPLGDGSYIWPRLSPDGTRLVASDMSRGVFITGLNGENITMLGKRNAPCWTRDGSWIIYMNDKDDGHNILSSDIMAVSADGQTTLSLTETADIIEMYPDCSPVDNSIVCSSLDGGLYLIRYGE
jgi:Tol biopolymer transport system component